MASRCQCTNSTVVLYSARVDDLDHSWDLDVALLAVHEVMPQLGFDGGDVPALAVDLRG